MESIYQFEHMSTKDGFNTALSHFRSVTEVLGHLEEGYNAADVLNALLDEREIEQKQVVPTISAILQDKYGYSYYSHTMNLTLSDFSAISKEVPRWKAVDVVLVYFHPDLGVLVINPKNPEHFSNLHGFKENELVTIYAGQTDDKERTKEEETAIKTLVKYLEGKKAKSPEILLKGRNTFRKFELEVEEEEAEEQEEEWEEEEEEEEEGVPEGEEATAAEPVSKKRRMTPFYAVPVTNELFHNGNVEAWKKIIQSYNAKHPNLEVYIYYDNERIHDIHSLFKWGKVKHGSTILFAVAGEDIQDIAKLHRYLRQGASPQFESFLRFPVNTILNLF